MGIWDVLGQKVTSLNIHYYIQVPAKTSVVLVTSNGEIRVRGIAGQVIGETMNGDVDVSSASGHVEVSTTNGDIRLAGIVGSARAGTTNGGISVEIRKLTVGEDVNLQTTNGNVSASLPGDLKATHRGRDDERCREHRVHDGAGERLQLAIGRRHDRRRRTGRR